MIKRCCPVCVGEDTKKVFHRDFGGMESIVPFSGYDVVQCTRCGAFYADNIGESIPLMQYYEQMSKYESQDFALSKASQEDHEVMIHFLTEHLNEKASVLDIGCGNGSLLYMLRECGIPSVTGLDPSEKNCRAIEERWGGIRAVPGALGEDIPTLAGEKFDCVVMKGVLEHLLNVRESVVEAIQYIAEGGQFCILVPHIGGFSVCPNLYQQFSVEHINFFTLASLDNLMGAFGMTCTAHRMQGDGLYTLWQRDESIREPVFDNEGVNAMQEYLDQSEKLSAQVVHTLAPMKGRHVCIWGAGTHTAMLHQLGLLDEMQVDVVVDSNVNYKGHMVYGTVVQSPDVLRTRPQIPIIISSQAAEDAILRQITKTMCLPNEVVTLYGGASGTYAARAEVNKRTVLADVIPLDTPYVFGFFVGDVCNFCCKYCVQAVVQGATDAVHDNKGIKQLVRYFMTWETFLTAAEQLRKFPHPLKKILFSSIGEPLLNPHLPQMIAYLNKYRVAGDYEIVSNASLLTPAMARALIDAGLTRLCVSVQGMTAEKYADICKYKVDMEKFVEQLRYFYKYGRGKCRLHIKVVDMALDAGEDELFLSTFKNICDTIHIDHVIPLFQDMDYEFLSDEDKGIYQQKLQDVDVCAPLFYTLYMNAAGDIFPCCIVPYATCYGNVHREDIVSIWNGVRRQKFLEFHLSGKRRTHEVCKGCILPRATVFQEDLLDNAAEELLHRIRER